jgi:predicted site-specific integrase-resolvase
VGHVSRAGQSGETSGKLVRAAQYVRMSTEHQKYSTENQSEAIREYAARRGIEIVRTYADEGKSGLSLDGRDALSASLRMGRFFPRSLSLGALA